MSEEDAYYKNLTNPQMWHLKEILAFEENYLLTKLFNVDHKNDKEKQILAVTLNSQRKFLFVPKTRRISESSPSTATLLHEIANVILINFIAQ